MTLLEVSFSGAVFIIAVVTLRALAITCFVGNGASKADFSL